MYQSLTIPWGHYSNNAVNLRAVFALIAKIPIHLPPGTGHSKLNPMNNPFFPLSMLLPMAMPNRAWTATPGV
jgi:hypothetical protein